MNKERRKAISDLIDTAEKHISAIEDTTSHSVEHLKSELDALASDIESIKDEEQDYYDNMPESFQSGDKGQNAEAAVSALEEAYDRVNDAAEALGDDGNEDERAEAINQLNDAISSLDEATA